LVYDDDVNTLGRSIHTLLRKKQALAIASKVTGLEVNAEKYIVMPQEQNAGWSLNIKTDNSSSERVEELKYLGTTLNQNSLQEEIKSRWNAGNACYLSEQNLLSSSLLSKNINMKVCIFLSVVLYGA